MYIHVTGGIGNQLFQYNLAHIMTEEFGRKVVMLFEDSSNESYTRENELFDILKTCSHRITIKENSIIFLALRILDSLRYRMGIKKSLNNSEKFLKQYLADDQNTGNPPFIFRLQAQDWRLANLGLSRFSKEINNWFEKIELGADLEDLCRDKFQLIHIRRGDYTLNPDSWGLLSLEYYKQNLDNELETVVITDDSKITGFLQAEFPSAKILGPFQLNQRQAIKLMSLSKRIIVANSSFSWWGSRFAREYSQAEVIFPDRWFKASKDHPNLIGDPYNKYSKARFE